MTIPMHDYKERSEALANAYWAARCEPGGTIEIPNYQFTVDSYGVATVRKLGTKVEHSRKAQQIWDEMGELTEESTRLTQARLAELGVPMNIVRWAGPNPPRPAEGGGGVMVTTSMSDNAFQRIAHFLELDHLAVAESAYRSCCHDGKNLIFTYCEGDVSIEWYWNEARFHAALRSAEEYYRRAAA